MKSGLAWIAAIAALAYAAGTGRLRAVEPVEVGNETQIFVDDALVASSSGVVRRVHPCRKLDRPVMEPEKTWEQTGIDQRIYVYGTALRDEPTGLLRMWYNRGPLVMLATSTDGLRWERTPLGLY